MFLRKVSINKDGKRHDYWALVESVRTERGPRQRIVSYLSDMDEAGRVSIHQAVEGGQSRQGSLFGEEKAEWVEVKLSNEDHRKRTYKLKNPEKAFKELEKSL